MTSLLYPMAFYVFYVAALGGYMAYCRVIAVRGGKVKIKYFRTYQSDSPETAPPERLVIVGRHYDNQFQLPLFFLIGCLTAMVVGRATSLTTAFAWSFVASRLAHSFVHLGSNNILSRLATFVVGWGFVCAIWTQVVWS
jgi:hypothetical protein